MDADYEMDESFKIPLAGILILEIICGFASSLSVVIIYWKKRQVRNIANRFITNLAVLDCAICVLCVPFTIARLLLTPTHSRILCCGHESITSSLRNASFLTLIIICYERYTSITSPFRVRFNSAKATRTLVILWIFSALSLGVPFIEWYRYSVPVLKSFPCTYWVSNSPYRVYYRLYYFPVFLLSCLIILPTYWKISKAAISRVHITQAMVVRTSISFVPNSFFARSNGNQFKQREMRIAKMTGGIISTVCVLWLPYMVLTFSMYFLEPSLLLAKLEYAFLSLGYLTCILNPVLYAFSNQKFRIAFFRVLPVWKRGNPGENRDE